MKSFKRGEKGFTLIELLIVVAILGVLAAVVIPNVVGLMGRGGKQAYQTDSEVIQLATSTFFSDVHGGFNAATPAWGDTNINTSNHLYPAAVAGQNAPFLVVSTVEFDKPNNPTNPRVNGNKLTDVNGTAASTGNISASAIWMGLLVNAPGFHTTAGGYTTRGDTSALGNDTGLYLQKMPKSAKAVLVSGDDANGALPPGGGYCWVVGLNGTVYGVYTPDLGETWYAGFSGSYP